MLSRRSRRALWAAGHDVVSILECSPSISDVDVLSLAEKAGRVLITDDKDFGDLAVRKLQPSRGVILLRTQSIDPGFEAKRVLELIANQGSALSNLICVVEEARFRIRSIGTSE
ncbi:MAG: DUF5615 family PIN-like protein [Hyphomicrobium sp.]